MDQNLRGNRRGREPERVPDDAKPFWDRGHVRIYFTVIFMLFWQNWKFLSGGKNNKGGISDFLGRLRAQELFVERFHLPGDFLELFLPRRMSRNIFNWVKRIPLQFALNADNAHNLIRELGLACNCFRCLLDPHTFVQFGIDDRFIWVLIFSPNLPLVTSFITRANLPADVRLQIQQNMNLLQPDTQPRGRPRVRNDDDHMIEDVEIDDRDNVLENDMPRARRDDDDDDMLDVDHNMIDAEMPEVDGEMLDEDVEIEIPPPLENPGHRAVILNDEILVGVGSVHFQGVADNNDDDVEDEQQGHDDDDEAVPENNQQGPGVDMNEHDSDSNESDEEEAAPVAAQPVVILPRFVVQSTNELHVQEGILYLGGGLFYYGNRISITISDVINQNGSTSPSLVGIAPSTEDRQVYKDARILVINGSDANTRRAGREVVANLMDNGPENLCLIGELESGEEICPHHSMDTLLFRISPKEGEVRTFEHIDRLGNAIYVDVNALKELVDNGHFHWLNNDELNESLESVFDYKVNERINDNFAHMVDLNRYFYRELLDSLMRNPLQVAHFDELVCLVQFICKMKAVADIMNHQLNILNRDKLVALSMFLGQTIVHGTGDLIPNYMNSLNAITNFYDINHIPIEPSVFSLAKCYTFHAELKTRSNFGMPTAKFAMHVLHNTPPLTTGGGHFTNNRIAFIDNPNVPRINVIPPPATQLPLPTPQHVNSANIFIARNPHFNGQVNDISIAYAALDLIKTIGRARGIFFDQLPPQIEAAILAID